MISLPPEGTIMVCPACEKKMARLVCSRCHDYNYGRYCSRECQLNSWGAHKNQCYPLDKELYDNKENTLLHAAMKRNLFSEYQAFISQGIRGSGTYDEARHLIYRGVIAMIMADPKNGLLGRGGGGDIPLIIGKDDITNGCRLLQKLDLNVINDKNDLLWSFIPPLFFAHIESLYSHL